MRIYFYWIVFIVVGMTSCSRMAVPTQIIVVRHADRTPGDDLTSAGLLRAEELKRVLVNTKIDSVFSTNFTRTKKTVQPLADAKNLPVVLYDNNAGLIERVLKLSKGKTVLVAGHSNTVPQLVTACGCTAPYENIPDTQFDNLFIIVLQKEKINGSMTTRCRLLHLKYGAKTD